MSWMTGKHEEEIASRIAATRERIEKIDREDRAAMEELAEVLAADVVDQKRDDAIERRREDLRREKERAEAAVRGLESRLGPARKRDGEEALAEMTGEVEELAAKAAAGIAAIPAALAELVRVTRRGFQAATEAHRLRLKASEIVHETKAARPDWQLPERFDQELLQHACEFFVEFQELERQFDQATSSIFYPPAPPRAPMILNDPSGLADVRDLPSGGVY